MIKRAGIDRENQDFRAAQVCMVLANINRDPKKKKKPYTINDFMPGKGPKKKTNRGKKSMDFFESVIIPSVNSRFTNPKGDK